MTSNDDLSDLLADLAGNAPAATDVLDSDRLRTRIHRRRRRRQLTVAGGSVAAAAAIGTATTFALGPDHPSPEPIASTQQAFDDITCAEPVAFSGPAAESPLELTVSLPAVIDRDGSTFVPVGTARITNVSDKAVSVVDGTGPWTALAQDGVAVTGAFSQGMENGVTPPVILQPGESMSKDLITDLFAGCPAPDDVTGHWEKLAPGHYEVYVAWRDAVVHDVTADLYSGPIPVELR